jgi:hypothetical protein
MRSRFQQRHYTCLAEIIRVAKRRAEHNDSPAEAVADIERDLIDLFARDNPKFKLSLFERAASPKMEARR